MEEKQVVALAALLHDVGKLLNRCNSYMSNKTLKSQKHPELSVQFIKDLEKFRITQENPLLKELVQRHHENPIVGIDYLVQNASNDKTKKYATIISTADNISSSERGEEKAEENIHFKKRPLDNILEQISLDKVIKSTNYKFLPKEFNHNNIFSKKNIENAQSDLTQLVDKMYKDLKLISNKDFNELYMGLDALLKKYTWAIASDTQRKIADISLYDHSRTTAAIALCIYLYHIEKGNLSQNAIRGKKDEKFVLIPCKLEGQEDFVSNINTTKKAAKRLRGRSHYIKLLYEAYSYYIIEKLELTISNVILEKDELIYFLLPNNKELIRKFKDITKDINLYFYRELEGEIYFNIATKSLNNTEFKAFNDVDRICEERLRTNKNSDFNEFILKEPVIEKKIFGVCETCGDKYLSNSKENQCEQCTTHENIGKWLISTKYIGFYFNDIKFHRKIQLLGGKVKVAFFNSIEEVQAIEHRPYVLNNIRNTEFVEGYSMNFRFTADYSPVYESKEEYEKFSTAKDIVEYWAEPKNFNAIAYKSEGHKKLGIVTFGVDNFKVLMDLGFMGSMDISNFKREDDKREELFDYSSISRVSTLNRLFNIFTNNYLYSLFNEKKNDSMIIMSNDKKNTRKIEINFSNHYVITKEDKIVIVCPWNESFYLANYIREKFNEFVGKNCNIRLSASIELATSKDPIGKVMDKGSRSLEYVQNSGGNALIAFEKVVPWNSFENVFELAEFFADSMDKGIYKQSFIYRLLEHTEMVEEYVKDCTKVRNLKYMSALQYDINRNLIPELIKICGSEEIATGHRALREIISKFKLEEKKAIRDEDFVYKYMKLVLNYAVRKNRGD